MNEGDQGDIVSAYRFAFSSGLLAAGQGSFRVVFCLLLALNYNLQGQKSAPNTQHKTRQDSGGE
jgi:hypothetical protein